MTALSKKMFRTIYRTRGQVLAVVMVILSGTACYIALSSCYLNLLLTRDTYYAQNRFADFEIMVERAPATTLFKLEEIPGVRQVRGRIVEEVKLDIEGIDEVRTARLVSMPDRRGNVLNNVVVTEGRYFEPGAMNEVIVSEKFGQMNGIGIGDNVEVTIDGNRHSLRVVGLGLSPEYVYIIRSIQELVPAPERFGILWVPEDFAEDAMDMQASWNNFVGSVEDVEQLPAILDAADSILDSYGVFARVKGEDQISNRFLSEEIKGLGATAKVLPAVFLGIAALVIMILLNRMVRNERTQIGLLKAYGYSNFTVGLHYLQYALILSIAGCVGGFFVGQWIAHSMIKMYVQFYQFPILEARVYPHVLVRAMGIAIAFSMAGAFVAARRAAAINPAESMRPPAPRIGTRTVLEQVVWIWSRLSFTWKMIARNVSRNKFRCGLNVFGVMISAALLIVGFFAIDAMKYIIEFQYEKQQRQDVKIRFLVERNKEALYEVRQLPYVREAEPVLEYPFEMKSAWRTRDVLVTGVPPGADLIKLIDTEGRDFDIETGGLVLSTGLADVMRLGVGDTVTLKPLMGKITQEKTVHVTKIVEQFFGVTSFMSLDALSRVLDEPFAMNAALIRTDRGMEHALVRELEEIPLVSSVEVKADSMKSIQDTLAQSMWIMSVTSVLFAGIISFAIIYNVTMVSLAERKRELASLRVMGFSKSEVGRILYYENFVTGGMGVLLGLPVGLLLCRAMATAYDNELFRFPVYIAPNTFVIAAVFTSMFIAIANFAVRGKINALDLVETLKARE